MEKKFKFNGARTTRTQASDKKGAACADDCCGQLDNIIGGFGKYQLMIFMFKILIGATSAFNNLGVTFFAPSDFISFWCANSTLTPVTPTLTQPPLPAPLLHAATATAATSSYYSSPTATIVADPTFSHHHHDHDHRPFNITSALNYEFNIDQALLVEQHSHADNYVQNKSINRVHHYVQHAPTHSFVTSNIRQLLSDFVFSTERQEKKHHSAYSSDTPRGLRKECDYLSPIDNKRHKCTSFKYDTGIWISTIIDEWDLVCDRALFISITQSLYMAGFIVSYLVFGYISDRFGRWKSLVLGASIEILSGFGCALAGSIRSFMIFRFLLGLGNAGRSSSSYLIMIEWTGPAWRMHISTLGSLGWVLGYCLMPWIVLFFVHFRHMHFFVCFYEAIFFIWLLRLPESPRWLLTHRRFDEAYQVLLNAAKFNGLIIKSGKHVAGGGDNNTGSNSIGEKQVAVTAAAGGGGANNCCQTNQQVTRLSSVNGANNRSRNMLAVADKLTSKDAIVGNLIVPQLAQTTTAAAPIKSTTAKQAEAARESKSLLSSYCCASGSDHNNDDDDDDNNNNSGSGGDNCSDCSESKWLQPYTLDEFDLKFARLSETISQKEFSKNEDRLSILDLFRWANLRKYTLILAFAWAVNSFIYYGIALRVGDLGGKNLFVSFTFAGATELPSIAFTMLCMKFLPRKTTNIFLFSIILLLCALQVPLKYYDLAWLQQVTMMLAKLFNSCSFTCILYQTMELFPTSIRQTAYSSCSLAGRVGSILAPFIKELSQLTNALVPPMIYACLSIVQIVLIRHLPETQGSDLPDTLLEAERFKGTDKANNNDNNNNKQKSNKIGAAAAGAESKGAIQSRESRQPESSTRCSIELMS